MHASPLRIAGDEPMPPRRSLPMAVLVSSRPKQWTKNLFVLAPLVFSGELSLSRSGHSVLMFLAFCAASSALYIVNDILDRELDRNHERKRRRPIACGDLGIGTAWAIAMSLLVVTSVVMVFVPLAAAGLLGLYVALTLAYSARLKHIVLLDVLVIAAGFVIRVAAGSYAIEVRPSEWLLLCTLFLALFLGFGKRRHELLVLGEGAGTHRPVLAAYTRELVDEFLSASMIGALLSYSMYTFFSETATAHKGLMLTIPFAVYGIFRYMLLVHTESEGGSPEELLLSDRPLQIAIALWGLVAVGVVYAERF